MTGPCSRRVGVVGAGTMGSGISQLFAMSGFQVVLVDSSLEALSSALPRIKEHTTAELWPSIESSIRTATGMNALSSCGLVIEAVFEDPAVKKEVLKAIEAVLAEDALIATNTSSISI
ncbi:partial 3-hydroxybutyryl-CoA dehydrogenase, partial [Planctomycetaceae bacterium]